MTYSSRPRRSALYLPGSNQRAMEKGKSLPADVLIFDLEDAVGPDAKTDARARVCAAVSSGAYQPREIIVRVNGLSTEWHDEDLAAVAHSGAHGVLVPKVESGEQVQAIDRALAKVGAPAEFALWVMIETPGAFLRVEEIAAASDRLVALVVGTNDLINEIHGIQVPGRGPILPALLMAVLGARAAGKIVLDGVFNTLTDADGFFEEARQGREMGFDGKTVIHPSQIIPANDVFGPTAADIDNATAVVDAYQKALEEGQSVFVVDGRMVEILHVRDAQRTLSFYDQIRKLSQENHRDE